MLKIPLFYHTIDLSTCINDHTDTHNTNDMTFFLQNVFIYFLYHGRGILHTIETHSMI